MYLPLSLSIYIYIYDILKGVGPKAEGSSPTCTTQATAHINTHLSFILTLLLLSILNTSNRLNFSHMCDSF